MRPGLLIVVVVASVCLASHAGAAGAEPAAEWAGPTAGVGDTTTEADGGAPDRPKAADAPTDRERIRRRLPHGPVLTGLMENDAFDLIGRIGAGTTTDRYYTHGTLFSVSFDAPPGLPLKPAEAAARAGLRGEGVARWGLSVGQNIYTPEDITLADPNPKDRPYAGWAYVAPSVSIYRPNTLTVLELQLGVVGPSAAADWVQGNFHDAIEIARAQGWDHQLKDEVAFALVGERRWVSEPKAIAPALAPGSGPVQADLTGRWALALGTVQVAASAGFDVRVGQGLGVDYGPPGIRPSLAGASFLNAPDAPFGWYLFAGAGVRAVGRDIFLDGNTWVDSPSVNKKSLVLEAQAGAALVICRRVRLAYSYVVRSEEFSGQDNASHFGTISASVLFGKTGGCSAAGLGAAKTD